MPAVSASEIAPRSGQGACPAFGRTTAQIHRHQYPLAVEPALSDSAGSCQGSTRNVPIPGNVLDSFCSPMTWEMSDNTCIELLPANT